MKRIWMMRFVRASERDKPGAGVLPITADCEEQVFASGETVYAAFGRLRTDLQGEKEAAAMRLEESTGQPWVCLDVVPLTGKGRA